ncbi:MAG: hypothetical protein MUO23_03560 [Anaerolineales bacterium]|nr:hypothetical protein [Anaerolineales bacterium]
MEGNPRDDIRRLLKSFGVQADEAILTHLAKVPSEAPLRIRLVLEDRTDYGSSAPAHRLHLEVEGHIHAS